MVSEMTGLGCITALKALGDETRLRILRMLAKDRLSVNELSEKLKVKNCSTRDEPGGG